MQTMKLARLLAVMFALCFILLGAIAEVESDKLTVPLADPSLPSTVKVSLNHGSITVNAYDGKDVAVEAKVRREGQAPARSGGMKRVQVAATGLSAEEENNQVEIGAQSIQQTVDITIQVPRRTSLRLETVNDGDITVTGVEGEIDVDNNNGEVTLKNVSGNAVAHAYNRGLKVTFDRINPQKPMAFSSFNGDVDVTFPSDLKANVSLTSYGGEVFSDFDIQLDTTAPVQTPTTGKREGRKFTVTVDKAVRGKINGGGQEIQFTNYRGNIYIRRGANNPAGRQ